MLTSLTQGERSGKSEERLSVFFVFPGTTLLAFGEPGEERTRCGEKKQRNELAGRINRITITIMGANTKIKAHQHFKPQRNDSLCSV